MDDLNIAALVGRLTRDAEVNTLPGGTGIAKFSLAVNRRRKSGASGKTKPASSTAS